MKNKDFIYMKTMNKLIQRFVEDLKLPQNIHDNLYKKRTNEELKVYASSLPLLEYPDTYRLAGRLYMYANIKTCPKKIKDYVEILDGILHPEIKDFYLKHSLTLDKVLDETYYENFKNQTVLSASANLIYLLKITHEEPPVETPCHCKLRQAVQFYYQEGIEKVLECYYELVDELYVHASPTMFNSGCIKNQLGSCYLLTLGDNLEDLLYTGVGDAGIISKLQGGIGMHLNSVRHSNIANSGKSGGIMPFGEIYDKNTKCVNQGAKRNGALTLFLNIWHIDVLEFIQARDNYTQNGVRFKSANTALFISNLFMERVKNNQDWTLFCPAKAKLNGEKLDGTYGDIFEALYLELEKEAPRRMEKFKEFDQEIKEMELKINGGETLSDSYIKNYYSLCKERVKLRKSLIEYKVVKALDLYKTICDMNVKSGMPYITYRDPTNIKNNMMNIGVTEGLNLCVAPETLILTDKGQLTIGELQDQIVNVWNGKTFSEVTVKKTSTGSELIRVEFDDNSYLECTKYHKFFIQDGYFSKKELKNLDDVLKSKKVTKIDAENLVNGMKLVKCNYPVIDGDLNLPHAYTNGFFTGDGTYLTYKEENKKCDYNSIPGEGFCKRHIYEKYKNVLPSEKCQGNCYEKKPMVSLYGEKIKLLEHLEYRTKGNILNDKLTIQLTTELKEKYFVPINYSLKSKLEWFAGLADADGCLLKNENAQSIQIVSNNKDFLLKVKYMLQTCGCNPKVVEGTKAGKNLLPDGKGGKKEYKVKQTFRILIASNDIYNLINNGFKTHRLKIKNIKTNSKAKFIKVKSVIYTSRISDTFCFTEKIRNAGVFNGIFAGNCLEITEPATPSSISSCNLGHINLKRYVRPLKEDTTLTNENLKDFFDFKLLGKAMGSLVENINKVIDYNFYPLDKTSEDKLTVLEKGKISQTNLDNRPIGIGVSGLAETFALLNLAFDSPLAKRLNKMIFASMYYYGLEKSHSLALVNGHYKNFREGQSRIFVKGEGWKILKGSPFSNGYLQFDLWQSEADYLDKDGRLDKKIYKIEDNIPVEPVEWGEDNSWDNLKEMIKKDGVYNSMILAPMPTASSAQIVRNAEAFEAHQTLIYARKLVHGNITTFSEPFVEDMIKYKLWNKEMISFIEMDNGSIRYIHHFIRDNPGFFKEIVMDEKMEMVVKNLQSVHRGMYEISQKDTMLMSRQRGIYVDQSQSLNIYIAEPTKEKMMGVHAYSNALRLKTGMYYLRQNPASQTDRFTVSLNIKDYYNNLVKKLKVKPVKKKEKKIVCNDEVCLMCQ